MGLLAAAGLLELAPSASLGRSARRLQEECEEAIDDNAPIYADALVAVIISLILLTIVFEKLHEVLEEKAKETMHGLEGVVEALMGELTVLGLLPPLADFQHHGDALTRCCQSLASKYP